MKFQAKLAIVSIPLLMTMANMSFAGLCDSPCDVNSVTSPAIRLNSTFFAGQNGQDWRIQNVFQTTNNSRIEFGLDGGAKSFIIEDDAATNTLVVDDANRVGIGTAEPAVLLELESGQPELRLNDRSPGAGHVDFQMNTQSFSIQNAEGWSGMVLEVNGGAVQHNQLHLDANGNVGIGGVTVPVADLHVGGDGDILLENGAEDWGFQTDSAGLDITRGNGGFTTAIFRIEDAAPSNSLVIDDTGNIGLGTSSPASSMSVVSSGADVLIQDTNVTSGIRTLLEMKNTGPVGFKLSDTTSSGEWAFRTGGGGSFIAAKSDISGPVMSFGGDGSVSFGQNPGIPSTASNMFLSPVGNLTIQGAFMTPFNTYADYVFESDYDLMPLDELQTFIKTKKHLPNVLSEAEVKKANMINLSELQITQLAKIEELTLYTLQQHQQIKALQAAKDSPNELAMTAIKELQKKFDIANLKTSKLETYNIAVKDQLKAKSLQLTAKNTELQNRLASLEKLVTNLALGQGLLPENGDQVVLNKVK